MTTVYSEEVIDIPFDKGLWYSRTPELIPDGYCHQVTNLMRTAKGSMAVRSSFENIFSSDLASTPSTATARQTEIPYPPDYQLQHSVKAYGVTTGGVGTPAVIVSQVGVQVASADQNYLYMANSNVGVTAQAVGKMNKKASDSNWSGVCQFKDRIYACSDIGIERFTAANFDFTGTAYTVGATPTSSVTNAGLIVFRDRIFAYKESRVYFTELRLSGGYPEDWNSGNNFLDAVSHQGEPTIHNAFVLGDRIFFFTDVGVYQLYAIGQPSGWNMELINTDVRVYGRHGVCQIKDVFVVTDRQRLMLFDGSAVTLFGSELEELFWQYESMSVFPFEKGVILQLASMVLTNDGTYQYWESDLVNRFFYFDGNIWVEITFPGIGEDVEIIGGYANKVTAANSTVPASVLVVIQNATASVHIMYLDPTDFRGDNVMTTPYTTRVAIDYTLYTKVIGNPMNAVKNYKYGYVDLYVYTGMVVNMRDYGGQFGVAGDIVSHTGAGVGNELIKVGAPGICNKMSYTVSGSVADTGGSNPNYPPVEIKKIAVIAHSHRNNPDQVTTT